MKLKHQKIIFVYLVLTFLLIQLIPAKAAGIAQLISAADTLKYDGSGVRIAIIDTGVSSKYLDGSHIADGKNYVFPGKTTEDLIGHGTAIAGIILGSEVLGLRGIAPDAEIVPLVYYSQYTSGVPKNGGTKAISEAIYDAIDTYGCRIVNISSGIALDDAKLKEAIAYAEEKNVLVVSSAGNTNNTSPEDIFYPAAYETVIGVGASDENNQAAGFSQRNTSVKLLAPGTDIPAVPIGNRSKPVLVKGSSFASAYVTGAAALLIECNPELSAAQLRELLYKTAQDLGSEGYDTETGWGMLDILKALSEAEKYIPFNDVSPESWYYDAAFFAYQEGLIKGTAENKFLPDAAVTRSMFVTLLYRLEKEPDTTGSNVFTDIKAGTWDYAAVCWAAENGMAAGSDGYFRPDEALTREDMARLLYQYAMYKGLDINAGNDYDLNRFSDLKAVSDYAISSVKWACDAGIISGVSDSLLEPKGKLTRAQAAVVIYRFSKHCPGTE